MKMKEIGGELVPVQRQFSGSDCGVRSEEIIRQARP
jgi:hypothetical protein